MSDMKEALSSIIAPGRVGIIVSCDPKIEHIEAMMDGKLEPAAVVFRWKVRGGGELRLEPREVTEEEAVAMVNKYLAENRIQFGFTRVGKHGGPMILGGH